MAESPTKVQIEHKKAPQILIDLTSMTIEEQEQYQKLLEKMETKMIDAPTD
jgi:3-hydroxyisobutyrate dehydrogenase-like beta-hydroxyacid dehydrogenase